MLGKHSGEVTASKEKRREEECHTQVLPKWLHLQYQTGFWHFPPVIVT